jgi:very-short-patch-repair endonuclease
MRVQYIKEFTYPDCHNIRPLPFDFYLPKYNGLIEYDGEQHFKEVPCWGGKKGLEDRQARDAIKTEFCRVNNIPLLRINYTQVDEDFADIIKDFVANPQEVYIIEG